MTKYGVFDDSGLPVAFYDTAVHRPRSDKRTQIPAAAVPITDEQWELYCTGQYCRGQDGQPAPYAPPPDPPEIAAARQEKQIQRQLEGLDLESVRPLRAILMAGIDKADQADLAELARIEADAQSLRLQKAAATLIIYNKEVSGDDQKV